MIEVVSDFYILFFLFISEPIVIVLLAFAALLRELLWWFE